MKFDKVCSDTMSIQEPKGKDEENLFTLFYSIQC